MHCVSLGESSPTSIYSQNLASIQPRTSLVTFACSPRTDPPGDTSGSAGLVAGITTARIFPELENCSAEHSNAPSLEKVRFDINDCELSEAVSPCLRSGEGGLRRAPAPRARSRHRSARSIGRCGRCAAPRAAHSTMSKS